MATEHKKKKILGVKIGTLPTVIKLTDAKVIYAWRVSLKQTPIIFNVFGYYTSVLIV